MIFGKTKLELKVGVFVFVGLVILAVFILSIGGFKTWSSGYEVNVTFNFVNGVKLGSPVRFAGLDTGQVKKIGFVFIPEEQVTKVKVLCWVKKGVQIPVDSAVLVNTLGLLGEKYVEIIPGKDYSHILAPDQTIAGIDPIPMHEVVHLAKSIADNINLALEKIMNKEGTLGKLIYDDAMYNELEAFAADIRKNPWKLFYKAKEKK